MRIELIEIKKGLPEKAGKYVVRTKKRFGFQFVETTFNGKTFDVHNQIVTHWGVLLD